MQPKTTTATADSLRTRKIGIEATLGMTNIFAGLEAADISKIADICRMRALKKSEILFREGEKAEGMYVIQSGQICIYRLAPAHGAHGERKQIFHVFGPGDSLAKTVLAANETYPANAEALKPSQVILVPKTPLLELIARKPQLALNILASMSIRMKMLLQSLIDLRSHQAEGRLAAWLLHDADNADGGQTVTLSLTKKMLAGQLCVTSETLSRMLARLKKERVLAVSKRQIKILNRKRLESYAQERAK